MAFFGRDRKYTAFVEELGLLPWREIEKGYQVHITAKTELGVVTLDAVVMPSQELIKEYNKCKNNKCKNNYMQL